MASLPSSALARWSTASSSLAGSARHLPAVIEQLANGRAVASVKQHLAALRMLFDYLVIGQVLPHNPANAVRSPKLVVRTGKTPVLQDEEPRLFLEAIGDETLIDLRDKGLPFGDALQLFAGERGGGSKGNPGL